MIDNEHEKIKMLAAAPTEAGEASVAALGKDGKPCPPVHERPMSDGEKWFDDFFYTKINYWLNLGMSLLVTDFFTHEGSGFFTSTGAGKKMLENGSHRLAKIVEAMGVTKAEKALSSTRAGLKTLALNSGGWMLLIPLFFAERNKRSIVHWKNIQLGVDQRAPDGHQETPEEIYIVNEQPVNPGTNGFFKDLAKILGRRTLASASTIVTGITLDKVATTKNPLTNETIYGQDRITNLVKDMTNNTIKLTRIPGNEKFLKSEFIQRYLGFAALDSFYTWMTATVMYMTNGSKKKHEPKEIEQEYVPPVSEKTNAVAAKNNLSKPRKYTDDVKPAREIAASGSYSDRVKNDEQSFSLAP